MSWQGKLFALPASSGAVDAGKSTYCPPADQRGVLRPQDGNGDGTAACDVGAVERLLMPRRVYVPLVVRRR